MAKRKNILMLLSFSALCFGANGTLLVSFSPLIGILCVLAANTLPLLIGKRYIRPRLRFLIHGSACLKIFLAAALLSIPIQTVIGFHYLPTDPSLWLTGLLICIGVLTLVFWNGIISLYCTSRQLGLKLRIIGALCGMIPIVNLLVLFRMLKVVNKEIQFEVSKADLNFSRKKDRICATKYPILLVHGVFFRDNRYFNYWGRIPNELSQNGCKIHYGNHPSAASVDECAEFLANRIRQITKETGCEKVNIIAHSKGGLDCRHAIAYHNAAPYVASLTTINTPHRGCKFADYLLEKIPIETQQQVAEVYNRTLRKMGEADADFMAAVGDLTSSQCLEQDNAMPLPQGIYTQSVGSKLNRASGGRFPLNFTYHLVRHFDGGNDGLVGEESFRWGEHYTFLETTSPQGISHGDMIDLNRMDLPDFDVREFYVQLVADLKNRGL